MTTGSISRQGIATGLALAALALPVSLAGPGSASAATGSHIGGRVASQPGTAAPTSFTLQRNNGKFATVLIHGSTVVERRYGAHTNVGAVSGGDKLTVWGTFESGNAVFDATLVQDNSIQ